MGVGVGGSLDACSVRVDGNKAQPAINKTENARLIEWKIRDFSTVSPSGKVVHMSPGL